MVTSGDDRRGAVALLLRVLEQLVRLKDAKIQKLKDAAAGRR